MQKAKTKWPFWQKHSQNNLFVADIHVNQLSKRVCKSIGAKRVSMHISDNILVLFNWLWHFFEQEILFNEYKEISMTYKQDIL